MIDAWMRRAVFWSLDFFRGGQIRKHYNEIRRMMGANIPNKAQLDKLLQHATQTTEYYSAFRGKKIEEFPILTKNDLRANREQINSVLYNGQELYSTHTSGSTGIPLVMKWNPEKRNRQLADLIYFNEMAGQKLGQPYAFYREEEQRYQKSKIERFKQNLTVIDITHIDEERLEEICTRLERRPYFNMCIGYASVHDLILQHMLSRPKKHQYHLSSLITSSEVLSLEKKQLLRETIGCHVYDRYSNEENGMIAQTGDASEVFKVNCASFYVEILKLDADEPAEDGEVGRIVLTDLYNYAVPLIRYDTGDLSICNARSQGWIMELRTIQGRQSDIIYDTDGRMVTTSAWNAHLGEFHNLRQYQLVQNAAKSYTLKVNGAQGIYRDVDLIRAIQLVLGHNATIAIEHVEGIPALSSGKFKKTVCNYKYNPTDYIIKQ